MLGAHSPNPTAFVAPSFAQFGVVQDSGAERHVLKMWINVNESNILIPLTDLLQSSQDTVRDGQERHLEPFGSKTSFFLFSLSVLSWLCFPLNEILILELKTNKQKHKCP